MESEPEDLSLLPSDIRAILKEEISDLSYYCTFKIDWIAKFRCSLFRNYLKYDALSKFTNSYNYNQPLYSGIDLQVNLM